MSQICENKIFLEDFRDSRKIYQISPITGKWSIATDVCKAKTLGLASDEIRIGFFKTKRVFVANFVHKGSLYLFIDNKKINLLDKGCVVRRRKIPLTCTYYFSVTLNDEVLISFWYSFLTFQTWPDDGDILTYVANIVAKSRRSILRSFLYNNPDFDIPTSKLDEEVDKIIKEEQQSGVEKI